MKREDDNKLQLSKYVPECVRPDSASNPFWAAVHEDDECIRVLFYYGLERPQLVFAMRRFVGWPGNRHVFRRMVMHAVRGYVNKPASMLAARCQVIGLTLAQSA